MTRMWAAVAREEAHRQSRAVSTSTHANDDQAFVDSVSDWPDE